MTYPLIIFDCDGTLVNSEYLNIKAIFDTIKPFGVTHYDMDYAMKHFSGHRFSRIVQMITAETGTTFPDDIAQTYLKNVRAIAPSEMKPVEGADDMVRAAQNHAEHIYVVSNGERRNVFDSLDFVNLRDFFLDDRVITGLMAPNPKPAPDLFLLASEQSNISPKQSLVIEDSVAGITGAVAAGMTAWGFCGTHHDAEKHEHSLREAGGAKVFHSMRDMIDSLNKV